ncbi:Band 7 protein family and Stomatin family-containing protein [Strongyloides ratti]|uniref:Band 7 protein family and Stomatin family-containing protein n=1 Tax=Strongyloides ratti TaxID=34506 RepID=A0A090L3A7_STRRB|nr:Band 7 protein family and Stomatin family-containing protein [Strongyloides ratti]CEF61984.1 Band 7 protein family and Stomatin family-containing protein [Strongyloides ratti]
MSQRNGSDCLKNRSNVEYSLINLGTTIPISLMSGAQRRKKFMHRNTHFIDSVDSNNDNEASLRSSLKSPPLIQEDNRFLKVPQDESFEEIVNSDTLEKIPIRARSQSWLIRTRHLYDDTGATKTPILSMMLYVLSIFFLICTFPWSLPFCVKVCREYERAVIFRLGRLLGSGTKGPGLYFIIPCLDTYKVVDLRVLSFDVPPQEILSRDSVTVSVEAVIYFRVQNPVISVTNVNDAQFSTKLLAQTTLRNVLGTKTLSEILQERDNIASVTEKVLDEGTDPWGVKVQRVEIKDIRLPHQLMRSMATEAEAARRANARMVQCQGEKIASTALKDAADIMCSNQTTVYLRYLQTLGHIANQNNETIVIPFPVEVMQHFLKKFGYRSCFSNDGKKNSSNKNGKDYVLDMTPIVIPKDVSPVNLIEKLEGKKSL